MRPMRALTVLQPLKKFNAKTIYRFDPNNDQDENHYWLEFYEATCVMRSPIAQDQWDRAYWANGIDPPKYAPLSMIITTDSDGAHPGASYLLGVPKPLTPPVVVSFGEVVNVETVTRTYLMTFVANPGSHEGAPSKTWTVQAVDGSPVKLTNIPSDRQGNTSVTDKNLYRKASDGKFHGVVQIPYDQSEYEDKTTDATLLTLPLLNVALSDLPPSPVYAPTATPDALPSSSTAAPINRSYSYALVNFDWPSDSQHYDISKLSPPVTVSAGEDQTVTVVALADASGSAREFALYRHDADKPTPLLLAQFPVTQTSYTDVIKTSKLVEKPPFTPAPNATAPAMIAGISVTGTGTSTVAKRMYMVTYIDYSGHEGPKSPNSMAIDVIDGVTGVALSHSEPVPSSVSLKRVYRQEVVVSSGAIVANDANWRLVAENSASATAAMDTIKNADLPGTGYPAALQGIPPTPVGVPASKATIPASVVPESRVYCYTLVTAYDEEGPPSDSSEVISCDPAKDVELTIPAAPGGNYNFAKKRIYRSATGTAQTKFQYVGEMPVATTTFVDKIKTSALGELLETEGWIPPPAKLDGLRLMANGAAVGFAGNSLYFSEPNLPHAWPHEYPIDDEIVGIGVFGQSVAVLTNGYPLLFQGIDPGAMASTRMTLPQACASKASIVETGDGVLYASADGLTMIGMATSMLTQPILSRSQWQDYNPASMQSYVYNGRVIITYSTAEVPPKHGVLVIDLSGASALFTTSDINAGQRFTAGYYSPQTDTLYFAQVPSIVRFDDGAPLRATWHSKTFRLPMHDNFGWAQVLCKTYVGSPMLQVFADGNLRFAKVITGPDQFRLPSGFKAMDWEFEIDGVVSITEVFIASSSAELQSA
jgi:hypothetical protein